MSGKTINTADRAEYPHPQHRDVFMRDVVTGAENPALSVHRGRIAPGGEILPHIHAGQTETFYILAGEALCTMGEEEVAFGAGSCGVAPAGVRHGLRNAGTAPVELLALFTPPLK